MDLRRLRHFSVLAETLNFSRAAERLHIAQPALSVSIQKLENELGTRLFERTSSGVLLTPAGKAGLIEAKAVVALEASEIDEIHAAFERCQTLETGKLGPAHAALEGRYNYGVLKCLLVELA